MNMRSILGVVLCLGGLMSITSARGADGGLGGVHSSSGGLSVTGGAMGTSPSAPGTNSLGTALSSSGHGRPQRGPLLGTNAALDREDAKVDRSIKSICRGC